jgi:transcriptional regulator with XRE-family HTH domain
MNFTTRRCTVRPSAPACGVRGASIDVAKKIADELNVTVDYLLGGSDKMVRDKKLFKHIEDIEAPPTKEKEKIFEYIDRIIRGTKIKKAHADYNYNLGLAAILEFFNVFFKSCPIPFVRIPYEKVCAHLAYFASSSIMRTFSFWFSAFI